MNHPLETGDAEGWVSVDGGRLRTLLARTAYAMSQDESRPFLNGVYMLVRTYSAELGFRIGAHALRATAATNALDNQADIAKVQEWLGHANIATTRIYDHRKTRPEDSPTFKVSY